MRSTNTILIATILLCLATGARADIVGANNATNCIPFGCAGSFGLNTYQQVYSSSAFSGVTSFDQISFFLSRFSRVLTTADLTIDFSYTTAAVNGLSSASPSDNIGSGETLFGTYALSGAAPSTLVFTGSTFNYDPSLGNLLMTISISGAVDSGGPLFETDNSGSVTSRAFFGSIKGADSLGLVTGFDDVPVSGVPEPASAGLLLTAVVWAGMRLRKAASNPTAQ